jgi:hypothetical protein
MTAPFRMEDIEAFHKGIADLDAFLIDPCVEGALDFEPGLRRCRPDQIFWPA